GRREGGTRPVGSGVGTLPWAPGNGRLVGVTRLCSGERARGPSAGGAGGDDILAAVEAATADGPWRMRAWLAPAPCFASVNTPCFGGLCMCGGGTQTIPPESVAFAGSSLPLNLMCPVLSQGAAITTLRRCRPLTVQWIVSSVVTTVSVPVSSGGVVEVRSADSMAAGFRGVRAVPVQCPVKS